MKIKLGSQARETIAAYGFLMPNLLGFFIFTSIPVLASLVLSFMEWDLLSPAKFVGFKNFSTLFADPLFLEVFL